MCIRDSHGEETIDRAVQLARESDVAIVALGDSSETSGENFDRTTLDLPGKQLDFLKAVYETGTPVVLVMNTGRPVSCVWEDEHIPAILQAGFNGEKGGLAAAQVLFGDVNPSGHLTMSYPRSVGQIPCHYSRKPAGGRKSVSYTHLDVYKRQDTARDIPLQALLYDRAQAAQCSSAAEYA